MQMALLLWWWACAGFAAAGQDADVGGAGKAIGATGKTAGGACREGLVLNPGADCAYPGTDERFRVHANGQAVFLAAAVSGSIDIDGEVDGRRYDMAAADLGDGSWRIERVGKNPGEDSVDKRAIVGGLEAAGGIGGATSGHAEATDGIAKAVGGIAGATGGIAGATGGIAGATGWIAEATGDIVGATDGIAGMNSGHADADAGADAAGEAFGATGAPIALSGLRCAGQPSVGGQGMEIRIEGEVNARTAVSSITLTGRIEGDLVDVRPIGRLAGGGSAAFTLRGTASIPYAQVGELGCAIDVEYFDIGALRHGQPLRVKWQGRLSK